MSALSLPPTCLLARLSFPQGGPALFRGIGNDEEDGDRTIFSKSWRGGGD